MGKIYKPIQIEIDNEESDDGFYSIGFIFNFDPNIVPHNIGLCRDAMENPENIYVEADDQIHGFYTQSTSYDIQGTQLTILLNDDKDFYWNHSKSIVIEIPMEQVEEVENCLMAILDIESNK